MDVGDKDFIRPGLGCYSVCQESSYFSLIVPTPLLWRSYGVAYLSVKFSNLVII